MVHAYFASSLFSPTLTRWIKFEEKVEKGGERWSKPHVATLSLHSLMELKTFIEKGTIVLDLEANSLPQIVGAWGWLDRKCSWRFRKAQLLLTLFNLSPLTEMITDSQIESGQLKADLKEKVTYTLLRKHRHQTKKSNLRSLADIGKTVSSASRIFSSQENGNAETLISPYQLKHLLLIFLFIFNSYCFRLFFF